MDARNEVPRRPNKFIIHIFITALFWENHFESENIQTRVWPKALTIKCQMVPPKKEASNDSPEKKGSSSSSINHGKKTSRSELFKDFFLFFHFCLIGPRGLYGSFGFGGRFFVGSDSEFGGHCLLLFLSSSLSSLHCPQIQFELERCAGVSINCGSCYENFELLSEKECLVSYCW